MHITQHSSPEKKEGTEKTSLHRTPKKKNFHQVEATPHAQYISIFLHQSSNYVHLEVLSIDKPRGSMALWYTNLKRNLSEKWKKIKTTQTRKKYIKLTCSNIPRGSMPCSIES